MPYYTLVKNGVVMGTIVADEDFLALISDRYDEAILMNERSQIPHVGFLYDSLSGMFEDPNPPAIVEEEPAP